MVEGEIADGAELWAKGQWHEVERRDGNCDRAYDMFWKTKCLYDGRWVDGGYLGWQICCSL